MPPGAPLGAALPLAQQPANPNRSRLTAASAAAPKPMSEMNDAELHAHCKALMGRKMDGRVPHDHSVEKLGHAPPPAKPLSDAEMKAQHDKCMAIMADASAKATKK